MIATVGTLSSAYGARRLVLPPPEGLGIGRYSPREPSVELVILCDGAIPFTTTRLSRINLVE